MRVPRIIGWLVVVAMGFVACTTPAAPQEDFGFALGDTVFAAVPGPGLLNALAAVSTAVAADQPVLALTGQIPSYQIGGGLGMAHELKDQLAAAKGVVDWARRALSLQCTRRGDSPSRQSRTPKNSSSPRSA